jgi:hypothetical protein
MANGEREMHKVNPMNDVWDRLQEGSNLGEAIENDR